MKKGLGQANCWRLPLQHLFLDRPSTKVGGFRCGKIHSGSPRFGRTEKDAADLSEILSLVHCLAFAWTVTRVALELATLYFISYIGFPTLLEGPLQELHVLTSPSNANANLLRGRGERSSLLSKSSSW